MKNASSKNKNGKGNTATAVTRDTQYDGGPVPLSDCPELEDVLPALAEKSRKLAAKIEQISSERKEIGDQIAALLEAAGHDSVRGDSWIAIRRQSKSQRRIKPELLLQHGVTTKVIEACTVGGEYTGNWYAEVRDV